MLDSHEAEHLDWLVAPGEEDEHGEACGDLAACLRPSPRQDEAVGDDPRRVSAACANRAMKEDEHVASLPYPNSSFYLRQHSGV